MGFDDILSGARQELRRGTIVPACLLLLRQPGYGYALIEELASEWNTEESRPRKFYRTSPDGERLAGELLADWTRIDASIRRLEMGDPR
jgi:PadR family transcriptional regulator PadR